MDVNGTQTFVLPPPPPRRKERNNARTGQARMPLPDSCCTYRNGGFLPRYPSWAFPLLFSYLNKEVLGGRCGWWVMVKGLLTAVGESVLYRWVRVVP